MPNIFHRPYGGVRRYRVASDDLVVPDKSEIEGFNEQQNIIEFNYHPIAPKNRDDRIQKCLKLIEVQNTAILYNFSG